VVDFRYAQFCPLTRAVEILGERWTILVVRELFLGNKRFSDLKAALNGVSPSVLADRLAKLEERGIVLRRELPPPSTSAVYELAEAGRALRPLLVELTRWGARFLGAPGPRDTFRPEWLLLGFQVFARAHAGEEIGALLHVGTGQDAVDIYIRGGGGGTVVSRAPLAHEATIAGPPMQMLMFVSGLLEPDAATDALVIEGDHEIARRIPSLFDFRPTEAAPSAQADLPPTTRTGRAASSRSARRQSRPAA
jgi:DNA-binding HxlR family transcriptional regulator